MLFTEEQCRKYQGSSVTVPDLSARELIELARKELEITDFAQDEDEETAWLEWDFMRGERGKTYEATALYTVSCWPPNFDLVREHFRAYDQFGSTAVLLAWLIKYKPEGLCTSVPEEEHFFKGYGPHEGTFISCREQGSGYRGLYVDDSPGDYDGWCTFLGFVQAKE